MLLVLDWETTGLTLHPDADYTKQPRAIEFGAALLRDGVIEEEISILINPQMKLPAIITKITGLTDEDLRDAPTFERVLPQLERVFRSATSVVAHNLPFDKAILMGELKRAKLTEFPWPKKESCTVGIYQEHWGRNPKLTELYERVMGKPLAQTHRAVDDVLALVEIIQKERLWQIM